MSNIIPDSKSTSGVLVKSHEDSILVVCDCFSDFSKTLFKYNIPNIADNVLSSKVLQIVQLNGNTIAIEYLIVGKANKGLT